jgi:predicted  nucleic acid-binding Zn-ribbon protein
MDVESASLLGLLELQAEDTEIGRLNDRRSSLPEAERLAEVTEVLAELDNDLEIARKQSEEVAREQSRLEGEMELLNQKVSREEGRLFSGAVSNPKELGALQAEVAMLRRRGSGLEDDLLEVMVSRDQITETLERLERERSTASTEAEELGARLARLTQEIDADLARHLARRDEIAATIPDDLLGLYERIRDQKHGVGAAALVGDTCQGCHTKLPSGEVQRLRAQRGLQRCDNCRRILVVT